MKTRNSEINGLKKVNIYTFSLSESPRGLSIWVTLLSFGEAERIAYGVAHNANKDRAEVYSIYAGLKALKEPCGVHIYSDSQFISNAITLGWIYHWNENGWKIHHKPVPNQDVWKAILPLLDYHTVSIEWVQKPITLPKMIKCREKAGELLLVYQS